MGEQIKWRNFPQYADPFDNSIKKHSREHPRNVRFLSHYGFSMGASESDQRAAQGAHIRPIASSPLEKKEGIRADAPMAH